MADVGKWKMIANSKGSSLPRHTESNTQLIPQVIQHGIDTYYSYELSYYNKYILLCTLITRKKHCPKCPEVSHSIGINDYIIHECSLVKHVDRLCFTYGDTYYKL